MQGTMHETVSGGGGLLVTTYVSYTWDFCMGCMSFWNMTLYFVMVRNESHIGDIRVMLLFVV